MSKPSTFTKAMSLLLAVLMVLSLLPVMGALAADKTITGNNGTKTETVAVGDSITLKSYYSDYASLGTFSWSSPDISINGSGSSVSFTVPSNPTSITVTCTFSSPYYGSGTDTFKLAVSGGSAPSTPTPDVPTDGSKTVSGVTAITVNKSWSGSGTRQPVTIGLYSGSSRVNSHVLQTSETSYTFSGLDSSKTYYIKEETTNSTWTTSYGDPNTSTSSSSAGWVEQSKGAVEAGKTYAFTYTSNGRTYLLGRSGTSVVGTTSGLTGGKPNANIGNDYKWQISSASSSYGDWYLKNLGNNYYLSVGSNYSTGYQPGSYLNNSASSMYSAMHLDDDGSIWNGYSPGYNLYAGGTSVGADSNSFTVFTPWLYSSSASVKTASYTITNTFVQSNTWTVTYNANGHGTAPAAATVAKGQSVTLPTMSAEGWIFKGWATSADGTPISGTSYTPTADMTLYAIWEKDASVTAEDGLTVSKSANQQGKTIDTSDTVTLDMEAYATGTTVTSSTTVETSSPMDILLVLDNTYSMTTTYGNTTRLAAMQSAAKEFVNDLAVNNDSKIAMVSFVIGNRQSPTTTDVEWRTLNANAKTTVNNRIDGLTAPDSTYGYDTCFTQPLQTAASMLNQVSNDNNKKIVVFFTDGAATESLSTIQSLAAAVKDKADATFSIGIVSGSAETQKAQALASDIANYYDVTAAGTMGDAFDKTLETIETITSSTSVTLDKNAVFQDVISTDKFDVTGATATVTIYDYNNGWSALTSTLSATPGQNKTLNSWTNKSSSDGTLTLNFNANGTVTVTGFSYKDHYLPTNGTEAQNVNAQKVHLTISGLKLKANAQTAQQQNNVPTNVEVSSGVFAKSGDTSPAVPFPVPTVNIAAQTQFTYYAKLVYHANGGQNPPAAETKSVTTTASSAAISFDQATPNPTRDDYTFLGWSADSGNSNTVNVTFPYSITTSKTTAATAETKTVYAVWAKNDSKTVTIDFSGWIKIADGVSSITSGDKGNNGEFKIFEGVLYYKLTDKTLLNTTNKNVILTDFEKTHDTVTVKLTNGGIGTYTAVPASNIYFDDNLDSNKLITNGAGGTAEESAKPTVGDITLVKSENGTCYTITFTGTGIDIYSTTDSNSGYVQAALYKGTTRLDISTMKNYSAAERYNVPSFSFTGYAHDTYQVKINVLEGSNYRFDGIRVYGPMDSQEVYDNTNEQYAVYANLREALINNVQTVSIDAEQYGLSTEENDSASYTGVLFIEGTSAQKPLPMTVTKDDGQTVAIYHSQFEAYKNNGPKHEIYLNSNQSIAFTLNGVSGAHYYIGLSAPDSKTGTGSVTVNNDDDSIVNVISPVDMYYDITEYVNGNTITIKNTGSSMISVTNLKITGDQTLFDNVRAAENGGIGTITITSEEGRNILFASAKRTVLAMAEVAETQPLEITAQPQNFVGKTGSAAMFKVEAAGDGLTYQWQYSDSNGRRWSDSTAKTDVYSTKLTSARNGRLVRCVVTDANGNTVTTEVVSMKAAKITVTQQPPNAAGKRGSVLTFTVEATGEGLTYQWQFSDNNGKKWTNSTVKSAVYSTKLTSARNGRLVRCVLTDAYGNSVTTDSAVMKNG